MKAHLLTAMMTVAAPLALADITLGTSTTAPAPAAASYVQTAQEVLAVVKELGTLLEGVTDQASADNAAAKVNAISSRMIELQKKAESMPRPSIEVENQVRASINLAEVQQVVSTFMNSFIRIAMNNGYGSQNLLNALGPVLNAMPGSQE